MSIAPVLAGEVVEEESEHHRHDDIMPVFCPTSQIAS